LVRRPGGWDRPGSSRRPRRRRRRRPVGRRACAPTSWSRLARAKDERESPREPEKAGWSALWWIWAPGTWDPARGPGRGVAGGFGASVAAVCGRGLLASGWRGPLCWLTGGAAARCGGGSGASPAPARSPAARHRHDPRRPGTGTIPGGPAPAHARHRGSRSRSRSRSWVVAFVGRRRRFCAGGRSERGRRGLHDVGAEAWRLGSTR
jgi:hypothetical protein